MTRTNPVRVVIAIAAAVILPLFVQAQNVMPGKHWVSAWSTAVHAPLPFPGLPPSPKFENRTIRMVVRPTISGERVRIRFSNAYGKSPLPIGAAHVALLSQGSKIVPGSDRVLMFGGRSSVNIPPGAPMLSDPVDLKFPALSEIAVSIWLSSEVGTPTIHLLAQHDTYISEPGDFTASVDIPTPTVRASWYWLADLEVLASDKTAAIVALGDSITDGAGAKQGEYNDWPDLLANRLAAEKDAPAMAVVNAGIGGNRILHDGAGVSTLARLDRDVFAQPGIVNVILLEAINDIGWPSMKLPRSSPSAAALPESPFAKEKVSAQDIIAGYRQIIDRAHQHGIRVFGATLTPYEGADYFTPEGETVRQAVNAWIRASGAFDGVFDFEAAVRDPNHPTRFRDGYHSGDNLHPSAVGYKAIADVIDLSVLRASGSKSAATKK